MSQKDLLRSRSILELLDLHGAIRACLIPVLRAERKLQRYYAQRRENLEQLIRFCSDLRDLPSVVTDEYPEQLTSFCSDLCELLPTVTYEYLEQATIFCSILRDSVISYEILLLNGIYKCLQMSTATYSCVHLQQLKNFCVKLGEYRAMCNHLQKPTSTGIDLEGDMLIDMFLQQLAIACNDSRAHQQIEEYLQQLTLIYSDLPAPVDAHLQRFTRSC